MEQKKQRALSAIEERREQLCGLSDALWEHPEVGFHENFAAQAFCRALEQEGFRVERDLAGIKTAFSGTFGEGGPVIGFLGEFDALPGLSQEAGAAEQKAIEEGAPGHGCGHNLLGVGSMAAAIGVKQYLQENHLPGTVKFFGCPAEEGGSGKGFMARAGVFQGVDIAFSWHPGEVNSVSTESTMANYQISYRFHGISAHAAMSPELGRSALDALELMNVGVQFLREHVPSETRIHYAITDAGGWAHGTIPEDMALSSKIQFVLTYTTEDGRNQRITGEKTIALENYDYLYYHGITEEELLSMVTSQYAGNYTLAWAQSHDYEPEIKTAWVNLKGYQSASKYLVWVNLTYQRVNIFEGSQGNWKLIRTCLCGSGTNATPTIRGVFTTSYKQTAWDYGSYYCGPIVRFYGTSGYAFHSRLQYWPMNSDRYYDARIGFPISHGCLRMYNDDIWWMYNNIPNGTTVVVH